MSDLEGMISSIMSDPEQMKKVMEMAGSLMGGGSEAAPAPIPEPAPAPKSSPDFSELFGGEAPTITPEMGAAAMKMLGGLGGKGNDKAKLLHAMTPYLSEPRRTKLEKAVSLARMLNMGLTMFGKGGIL